jgi:hypothetical protein
LPTLVSVYYHFVGRDDPLIPASPVTREIHELPHRPGNPRPTTARLAAHSLILLIIGIIVIDLAGQAIHVYYAIGTGGGAIAATIAYSTWAFPITHPKFSCPTSSPSGARCWKEEPSPAWLRIKTNLG